MLQIFVSMMHVISHYRANTGNLALLFHIQVSITQLHQSKQILCDYSATIRSI